MPPERIQNATVCFLGALAFFYWRNDGAFYSVAVTDCSGRMGCLGIDSAVAAGILFIEGKAAS